jgi:hypothetical protein
MFSIGTPEIGTRLDFDRKVLQDFRRETSHVAAHPTRVKKHENSRYKKKEARRI